MMVPRTASLVLGLGIFLGVRPLVAQSARPLSIQASYLRVSLFGSSLQDVEAANGFEGQLRYTRGKWSVGAGLEYSRHGLDGPPDGDGLRRIGPFVEPRLLIPSSSNQVAAYLAGRVSVVRVSAFVPSTVTNLVAGSATGATVNAGFGVLIGLSPRVNLDIGASAGYSSFGSVKYSSGSTGQGLGTGSNLIMRTGFSLGL